MADHDTHTDSVDALPTHLTVHFAPESLPSGVIDLQDLSQFLMGLQKTLDAKVRHDFDVDNIESERFRQYQLVITDVRAGSVECDVVFNLFNFSHNTINVNAPLGVAAVGAAGIAAAATFGPKLFDAFMSGAASEVGKQTVQSVSQVLKDMPEHLRRYLRDFVRFLGNVTGPNPTPVSSELLDRAEQGLKDMAQVGAKDAYTRKGIVVRSNGHGDTPIIFDRTAKSRVLDLLDNEVTGEYSVTARGTVTALDIEQNVFRLREFDRRKALRCRYEEAQQNHVMAIATPPNNVVTEGVPHYRKGSDRSWPPLYLLVEEVQEMPTLWNMPTLAQ